MPYGYNKNQNVDYLSINYGKREDDYSDEQNE